MIIYETEEEIPVCSSAHVEAFIRSDSLAILLPDLGELELDVDASAESSSADTSRNSTMEDLVTTDTADHITDGEDQIAAEDVVLSNQVDLPYDDVEEVGRNPPVESESDVAPGGDSVPGGEVGEGTAENGASEGDTALSGGYLHPAATTFASNFSTAGSALSMLFVGSYLKTQCATCSALCH